METAEPEWLKFAIDGIEGDRRPIGHRFMAPRRRRNRATPDFEATQAKNARGKGVTRSARRKDIILAERQDRCGQGTKNFELVEDSVWLFDDAVAVS